MSDGSRLRQSWLSALNEAEAQFRQLLTSQAVEWKRLSNSLDSQSAKQKGKAKVSSLPELSDVVVHRSTTKAGEDVYRMVLDVPMGDEQVSLEPWKAVLTTPELRQEWDPAVEDAHLVEVFDHITRVCKTNYTLGWPANPRDSITISRAFDDDSTLIDITTSLPRSADEPVYLRPSPPFVRSHVHLFAWCIQYIQSPSSSPTEAKKPTGRIRITCFWQHDLKALWGFGLSTLALTQQLSTMTLSLFKTVMKRGGRVAKLTGYGNGISIERVRYQIDREALTLDYAIIPDDDEHHHEASVHGMEELHAVREHRRLTRSIECVLPMLEGWDVLVTMKGSSEEVESIPWSAHAIRSRSSSSSVSQPDQVLLRITHGVLTDDDAVLKVKVVIEVSGASRGVRLNGLATKIHDFEERDPSSRFIPQKILEDVASAVDLSIQTAGSSVGSAASTIASSSSGQPLPMPHTERTAAAEKSILSKVRRNYIYFSSLLQEPEAKWRRTTEARGVSITQLDSIDPTLVVYRAEATFVGINIWDLYSAVVSPGTRVYWDKQHEDGVLLEDVNELTELWHIKSKPAWPVTGRDSVVLKTVYKSPTTIHVFCFSADDTHLFPNIPPTEPTVIRTQVDLQGWAIESLSPTTTLLTLLEQSDPKGWTGKTSIPTQMITTLAGIGEFAIKCGGPPVVTRLSGAKANEQRYDHERGSFKIEYEPSLSRRANNSSSDGQDDGSPSIELQLRCDLDTWAASLDIVVDPPPQTITCLRRHRLSPEGGGLWLTLTHDSILMDDERLLVLVRRAPGKEKGLVMVNGAKVAVDVEELPEQEIKALARQKRVKPPRIPLDQPPVMGVIRRRKAEWSGSEGSEGSGSSTSPTKEPNGTWASAPRMSSPLARFWTYAVDQATTTTQQAVAAIAPATYTVGSSTLDPAKLPMQYALEVLAWAQEFNSKPQSPDGWISINDKGMVVQKKLIPEISPYIPVHKGFKVIESVSAEELASVIMEDDCRKIWDERYDSSHVLETYGGQARTAFLVAKGGFPFRDRGLYVASVVARPFMSLSTSMSFSRRNTMDVSDHSPSARNTIFCVSASFSPEAAKAFSAEKYNPYNLPIGRVYVDAWILETLDPYTTENYAIPSTRCTRLVAVDYAGSIPAAFNSMINATLARGVLGVEAYMKNNVKASLPITRLPAPGLVISDRRPEDLHGAASSASGPSGTGSGGDGGIVVTAPFMAWKLRKRDENRVLVQTKFDVDKVIYRTSVVVRLPPRSTSAGARPSSHRREASASTVITNSLIGAGGGAGDDSSLASSGGQSQSVTPRPSRLTLNHSPQRRQREPSGQSLPDVGHDSGAPTPMLPMPGSMIVTPGLPSSTTFPSSPTHISGLPSTSSISAPLFPSSGSSTPSVSNPTTPSDSASAFKSKSPARTDRLDLPSSSSTGHHSHSSMSVSPPPPARQRAQSSGSGAFRYSGAHHQASTSMYGGGVGVGVGVGLPDGGVRGRTISSAFMARGVGEGRGMNVDFVVLEVVLDLKMFGGQAAPGGATYLYAVDVKARRRVKRHGPVPLVGAEGVVKENLPASNTLGAPLPASAPTSTSSSTLISSNPASEILDLPFAYTVHTVPSSPLHSSGLSSEAPSRHLLRVTLPTAQYRVNSIWDPLVGAMTKPPKKPEWMRILEGGVAAAEQDPSQQGEESKVYESERGGGIVVDVVVRPWGGALDKDRDSQRSKDKEGTAGKKTKTNGKMKRAVLINGMDVVVVGEKESLTSLGREELADDRVGKMGVLSRVPNESEPLPGELKAPIGIAQDLLLGSVSSSGASNVQGQLLGLEDNGTDNVSEKANGEDSASIPDLEVGLAGAPGAGNSNGGVPHANHAAAAGVDSNSAGGFLGFLQTYPNAWTRFGFAGAISGLGVSRSPGGGSSAGGGLPGMPEGGQGNDNESKGKEGAISGSNDSSGSASGSEVAVGTSPGMGSAEGGSAVSALLGTIAADGGGRVYPLSTLVFVALIAFLIGSLLRSLLSPADFIYVVRDLEEVDEKTVGSLGWREIRRLLEIKYLVGGWDFQVAVVRRH